MSTRKECCRISALDHVDCGVRSEVVYPKYLTHTCKGVDSEMMAVVGKFCTLQAFLPYAKRM